MRHTLTLTVNRMRLALRTPAFIFFSLAMPLAFLFTFCGLFGHGRPQAIPYLLASVLALTVMGSFWGLSLQLVTYREMGILRRFHLAPIGAGAMLASSILSNYLLTLPTVVLQFLLARWVFHLPTWGNLTSVLVMVTLGTVTFAALGLIVASVTNTAQETQIINNAFWLVFLFLSGATLPLPLFPNWLQGLALLVPATYLVSGFERALTSGTSVIHLGGRIAFALGLCRARSDHRATVVPMGSRPKGPAPCATLGRLHDHSVHSVGRVGDPQRCLDGPRARESRLHGTPGHSPESAPLSGPRRRRRKSGSVQCVRQQSILSIAGMAAATGFPMTPISLCYTSCQYKLELSLAEKQMAIEKTEQIWHNGKFIRWDDAKIHVLSHVVSYGSAVFEGIRCYDTKQGPAIFRLREHMQRMVNSGHIYRMELPVTLDELCRARRTWFARIAWTPLISARSCCADTGMWASARKAVRWRFTSPASPGARTSARKRWSKAWMFA